MHLKRVIREQLAQAAMIAAGLIERIVLTAVLLRVWGVERFEVWTIAVSIAALVALFELGFNLYFNNRLMELSEQGRNDEARRTFFVANSIFLVISGAGFAAIAAFITLSPIKSTEHEAGAALAALVLAGGYALKIAASASLALYRANRQYARLAVLLAIGEVARVAVAIIVTVAGGGLLAVAVTTTAASILLSVVLPVADAARRFAPHRIGLAMPRWRELKAAITTSSAFFAQGVPIILIGALPPLYLGGFGLGTGALAAFVLMRTLSGLPRTLLQQWGIVLGQEVGRRLALDDRAGAYVVISEGARFYSVLSGLATGLLLGAGGEIVHLWAGGYSHYRHAYLAAAALPMMLAAVSVLAHNILTATNAPKMAAIGRWLQLAVTVVAAATLPIADPALAVLAGLAMGEIAGFAPLAYLGVLRLVPGTGLMFHIKEISVTLVVAATSFAITAGFIALIVPMTIAAKVLAITLSAAVCSVLIPVVGLRARSRQAMMQMFIAPGLARLGWISRRQGCRT